jgi:hypothetical protein
MMDIIKIEFNDAIIFRYKSSVLESDHSLQSNSSRNNCLLVA